MGRKVLERGRLGDYLSLESLLKSSSPRKKARGLMGMSLLGLSSNGTSVGVYSEQSWEVRRLDCK